MEWIYTKDKLPNETEQVLVLRGSKIILMMYNHRIGIFEVEGGSMYFSAKNIDAWMPIPKPPVIN